MGYKLFMAGIWGNAGDIDAQYKETKIVIKKAAPGTFFALFGSFIVSFTLWKGLEFNKLKSTGPPKSREITHVSPASFVEEGELMTTGDSLLQASEAENRTQHVQNSTPRTVQNVAFVEDNFSGDGTNQVTIIQATGSGPPSSMESSVFEGKSSGFQVSGSGPVDDMLNDSNSVLGSANVSDSISPAVNDSISGPPD